MQITPIAHLTPPELIAQGRAAADPDHGKDIYEASLRSGLENGSLLFFEQGYFERRFELMACEQVAGQGVGDVDADISEPVAA